MNLHSMRGGTAEELESKQYRIGVGISLGNKWFTPENIVESIRWALKNTKDVVVVYVADTIHAINLEIRSRISYEKALKEVIKSRTELYAKVQDLGMFDEKVIFATWDDLVDDKFKEKVKITYEFYDSNSAFREHIHALVRNYTSKEVRSFSDADIHHFGKYLIEEIPEIVNRVSVKGFVVDAYTYPYDNDTSKLAEQIQMGEIFPELKAKIMDTEPKVFLEVR